MTLLKDVSDS